MRFVTLLAFWSGCAAQDTGDSAQESTRPEDDTDGTVEMGDPTTWALEVDVNTTGDWIGGLPATVYRSGSNIAYMSGTVGQPMIVGEGSYRIMVGPYNYQSDSAHPYYSWSSTTTEDGYPLVIVDYQRYAHSVEQASVDEPLTQTVVELYPVMGEGWYSVELHEYDYDSGNADGAFKGDDNGTRYLGETWIAWRDISELVPTDDRTIDGVMHVGDQMYWDGAEFSFTFVDEQAEVLNVWREGIGNNDWGFTYIDPARSVVTDVKCYYADWGAWYGSF